jgi:G3E family GTPase
VTIPCHLIAGSLGVGKTTAIRQFIAQSPDYVAVIVNDFGETGYDASFITEAGGADKLRVENVPGGCLCCTSAAQLLPALKRLCARSEVDRIIIEPSGIALLDPLLKMLHAVAPEYGFELAPVIVIFDPTKTRPATLELIPYWRHLADRADIVVLNRCDLASPEAVEQLFQYLAPSAAREAPLLRGNDHRERQQWDPPKLKVIRTSHGELPPDLFDLRCDAARPADEHRHHAELPPAGTFRSEGTFRIDDLIELLEELAPQLDRFKGVFQTDQGGYRMEVAAGHVSSNPAPEAAQTSADWIGSGSKIADRLKSLQINA